MAFQIVCLVFAFVLFILSAVGVPEPWRFKLISAGLACWVFGTLGPLILKSL